MVTMYNGVDLDEICTCGHLRAVHEGNTGDGQCHDADCWRLYPEDASDCKAFTLAPPEPANPNPAPPCHNCGHDKSVHSRFSRTCYHYDDKTNPPDPATKCKCIGYSDPTDPACDDCWFPFSDHVPPITRSQVLANCDGFRNHRLSNPTNSAHTSTTTNPRKEDPMATATVKTYTLPGTDREYITRPLQGFENDVEGLRELRALGKHILLLGEPGCGKTALMQAAFPDAENEIGHSKMQAPDMLWRPRIDPTSTHGVTYDPSPLTRAATKGLPFYLDETMRLSEDGFTPLFSAMDGRGFIVGGNLDGTDLPVAPGFFVVGASNPLVRGAFLPDAIASRFHIITVETSEDLLNKLGLDERILVAWRNLSKMDNGEVWRPSIREMLAAQDFINAGNMPQAAYALTGWRIPARDRATVAGVISPLLGVRVGDLGGVIK